MLTRRRSILGAMGALLGLGITVYLADRDLEHSADLEIVSSDLNAGRIASGIHAKHTLRVQNRSGKRIRVNKVFSSCDCTLIQDVTATEIGAGQSLNLDLVLKRFQILGEHFEKRTVAKLDVVYAVQTGHEWGREKSQEIEVIFTGFEAAKIHIVNPEALSRSERASPIPIELQVRLPSPAHKLSCPTHPNWLFEMREAGDSLLVLFCKPKSTHRGVYDDSVTLHISPFGA